MNAGKYGRSSAALKELLALDPNNMEARRLFATLHLRLGSLLPAKHAFDSLIDEAFQRQDYWLAESLLREYLATAHRCVPFLEKLGSIYQEKGDALEAATEYGKAIDILIEDPDSENPQRAAQLYAKIRDLAPASPVAFRLASFFDAQTGELLARQPGEDTESTCAPTADAMAVDSESQAHSQPTSGGMPWELPNLTGVDDASDSPSALPPASTDVSVQETQSPEEQAPFSGAHCSQQTEEKIKEVRDEISAEIRTQEVVTTPPESAISDLSGQISSEGVLSEILQSDSVGETSVTQEEVDPIVLPGDAAVAKDQGCVFGETQQEVLIDALGASEASVLTDSTTVLESPGDTAAPTPDTEVIASSQMEEDSSSTLSVVEPVPTEPTESQDTTTSFLQSVEVDSQELSATQPSGSSDASTEASVSNESSESRPQTGFTWKSVFASPWKSESHDSENAAQSDEEPPRVEELVAEAPTVSSSQGSSSGDSFLDSREGDQQPTHKDESSAGHPITPMPWDQVQESDISIHPAQVDSPVEEPTDLTGDRSIDEVRLDWAPGADTADGQAPPLDTTSSEADSLSVVRDSEASQLSNPLILPEDDRTAAETSEIQSSSPLQLTTDSQETDSFTIVEDSKVRQPPDASPSLEVNHAADVGEIRPAMPTQRTTTLQEADSFSIVQDSEVPHPQDTPISLEDDRIVAEVGQASSSTQEESTFLKPEQQNSLSTSSAMDEAPTPEEQTTGVAALQPSEEPIADGQAMGPGEIHSPSADSILRLEDESTPADLQLSAQKDSVETPRQASQHTDEAISEMTSETSSFSYSAAASSAPSTAIKQNVWDPEPEIVVTPSVAKEAIENQSQNIQPPKEVVVESRSPILEPVSHQEEWQKAGESIRFVEEPQAAPMVQVPPPVLEPQEPSRPLSAAASAVEVLFESSPDLRKTETKHRAAEATSHRERGSRLSPIRTAIAGFLSAGFSTTRAIVATCVG